MILDSIAKRIKDEISPRVGEGYINTRDFLKGQNYVVCHENLSRLYTLRQT